MNEKLEAAIKDIAEAVAANPRHPIRIAYETARSKFPDGGEEARAAFYEALKVAREQADAAERRNRGFMKQPLVHPNGVPHCSHEQCPQYARYLGRCTAEEGYENPVVCIPAVRDMVLEIDARRDAADPAFDEIVQLCGLAKTWEYPGQVIRDVQDALARRDAKISELEERLRTAEQVRDDARAASQRDLEARRAAQAELQRREKHPMAPAQCPQCKWTNTNLMNYSLTPNDGGRWLCHGCAARVIECRDSELSGMRAWRDGIESGLRELLLSVDEEHRSEGAMRGAELTIERLRTDLAQALQKLIVAGQVPGVRVEKSIDDYEADIAALVEQNQKLQACIVYVRDRRGGAFDYDTWARMVEHALDNKIPPGALEEAQAIEAKALDAARSLRAKLSAAEKELEDLKAKIAAVAPPDETNEADDYDRATGQLGAPLLETKRCGCSEKYRELAPGVHARYCALAGLPLARPESSDQSSEKR